jgi:hypothetical protein
VLGRDDPVQVAADPQVEVAVEVGVEEGGARGPAGVTDSGASRRVGEVAATRIREQHVRPQVGDEEVDVAIAVRVTARDAHPDAAVARAAPLRDVGEGPGARILEQLVRRPLLRRVCQRAALHEVGVEVAVVVHVEERRAAGHDLRHQVLATSAAVLGEDEAARLRLLGEPGRLVRRVAAHGLPARVEQRGHRCAREHGGPSHRGLSCTPASRSCRRPATWASAGLAACSSAARL